MDRWNREQFDKKTPLSTDVKQWGRNREEAESNVCKFNRTANVRQYQYCIFYN